MQRKDEHRQGRLGNRKLNSEAKRSRDFVDADLLSDEVRRDRRFMIVNTRVSRQ